MVDDRIREDGIDIINGPTDVQNTNVTPNDNTFSRNEFSPMRRNIVDHPSGESILTDEQRVLIEKIGSML